MMSATDHIVNFSGGVCSFWAAYRVIQRHGLENVTLLFADVLIEDEDLYRFNDDVAEFLGVPITVISRGLTPWELFRKEGMIGNSRVPLCSIRLKRQLLDEWHQASALAYRTTIYVGMDWTEGVRLDLMRKAKPQWRIEAPMLEKPLWDKCRMLEELVKLGIRPPRLYSMGFAHNNCGAFCVKAGQAQFALLLKKMPSRYAFHEAEEEETRALVGDFSILSDRRVDGKKKPLTLRQLRHRIEDGEEIKQDRDWAAGCGCSLDY